MTNDVDERLARIVARRREQQALWDQGASSHAREHRQTRTRVLGELPRLMSRITSVVAELNERLDPEGLVVLLGSKGHEAVAEAVYSLSLADDPDSDTHLVVSIDWSGVARAVLRCGGRTSSVLASTVFDLDKSKIMDLVLTFLEARFP